MTQEMNAPVWNGLPGRQWILEAVVRSFARLADPEEYASAPLLLTLRGSPGSGKTAALHALRAALETQPTPCLGYWDARQVGAADLLAQVGRALEQAPAGQRGVLLVDNLDALLWEHGGEPFFEFERRVAHLLVQRNAVVLVAAGRVELPWREYAVRVRHQGHVLAALTAPEVAAATAGWEPPVPDAYARTLGHPWTLERLRESPGLSEEQLARRAAGYFLSGLPPETADLARMAGLTLVFDVALLRELAPTKQGGDSDGYYLEQIRGMRRAGLVNWEVGVGYRFFDSAVRRLLARSLFYESSRRFEEFHVQAWDYYRDVAKGTDFLAYSLPNAVYHRAQMYRALGTPPDESGKRCAGWVQESLPQWKGAPWEAVARVWAEGMGERLIQEELILLLGNKAYGEILEMLQRQAAAGEVA